MEWCTAELNACGTLRAHDFTVFQFFHEVALEIEFSGASEIKEEHSLSSP